MTDYIDSLQEALRDAAAREYPTQATPVHSARDRHERFPRWLATGMLTRARLARSAAALALLATAAVCIWLLIGASATTQPAYALTRNANGTVTVTINDIATAIPALNARFRQMGIDETVIPVRENCKDYEFFGYANINPAETLTFDPGHAHLSPGYAGVLAAKQLPDGHVALSIGARKPPLPTCVRPIVLTVPRNATSTHH